MAALCARAWPAGINSAHAPSIALKTVFQEGFIVNTSAKGGELERGTFSDMVPVSVNIGTFSTGTSGKIRIIRRFFAKPLVPSSSQC